MRPPALVFAVPGLTVLFAAAPSFAQGADAGAGLAAGRLSPEVFDPLLSPVSAATRSLRDWEEGLRLLTTQNAQLKVQAARLRQAEGRTRAALATVLPSLQGSAGLQYNLLAPERAFLAGVGGAGGGVDLGGVDGGVRPTAPLGVGTLQARQSLFDWADWQRLSASRAQADAEVQTLGDTQRRVLQELSRAVLRVVASERLSDIERVALRDALERLELSRRAFALGAGNKLDALRLEQDAQVAKGAVLTANEGLRQAREALGVLLGEAGPVGVSPSFTLRGLPEQVRGLCQPLDSVAARADLRAQRALVEAARSGVRAAVGEYLPTVAATSQVFGFTVDPGFAQVPVWNIAAVLEFTFWDGGAREGSLTLAKAQAREAEEAAAQSEREAAVEWTRARRGVEVASAQVREAERARTLARETDLLTRRAFEVGQGTSLELVQTATALRQAELLLALREFDLANAVIDAFLSLAECRL